MLDLDSFHGWDFCFVHRSFNFGSKFCMILNHNYAFASLDGDGLRPLSM